MNDCLDIVVRNNGRFKTAAAVKGSIVFFISILKVNNINMFVFFIAFGSLRIIQLLMHPGCFRSGPIFHINL